MTFFISCTKEEVEPDPITSQSKGNFNYSINGAALQKADSAVYYALNTTVYAYKNGTSTTFEINLDDLIAKTYYISSATGNEFKYTTNAVEYNFTGGNFIISSNTNNKLAGSFNCSLSGGTFTSATGNFSDLPRR
jgi:hypothetical protein